MGKTLYVLQAVRAGGSATSLLNLLSLLEEKGEKADLFLLEHDGLFLDRAKQCANLLPEEKIISSIVCKKSSLKNRGLQAKIIRMLFVVMHHIIGDKKTWNFFMKRSAKKIAGYDTIIAFQESMTTEYCQYIPAKKRISWCHMDYKSFAKDRTVDEMKKLYSHFSEIACVSEVARKSIIDNINFDPSKVHLIYNTIPPKYIIEKSKEETVDLKPAQYTFVSMGRFVKRKGFDRVVYVAKNLKNKNIDFVWYILGHGEEYNHICDLIKENNLEDYVILTGIKKNPFPYIAKATCFVMSSESEAQPMVLNEAFTLGIPVVTTDFSSSREVVTNEVNGLIVPNSAEGLLEGVERIINDPKTYAKIKDGAKNFYYDNEKILNKIREIVKK